jgi:hypothetical protein
MKAGIVHEWFLSEEKLGRIVAIEASQVPGKAIALCRMR